MGTTVVRHPAVAGRFYPSNPKTLRSDIQSFTDFVDCIFIKPRTMIFGTGHPGQSFRSRGERGFGVKSHVAIGTVNLLWMSVTFILNKFLRFDGDLTSKRLGGNCSGILEPSGDLHEGFLVTPCTVVV